MDEIYKPGVIVNDIFRTIVESKYVICDLSGQNPNVLYEIGLAHAQDREVIILVRDDRDVPFDLKSGRYIKYLSNSEGLRTLENDLGLFLQTMVSADTQDYLK